MRTQSIGPVLLALGLSLLLSPGVNAEDGSRGGDTTPIEEEREATLAPSEDNGEGLNELSLEEQDDLAAALQDFAHPRLLIRETEFSEVGGEVTKRTARLVDVAIGGELQRTGRFTIVMGKDDREAMEEGLEEEGPGNFDEDHRVPLGSFVAAEYELELSVIQARLKDTSSFDGLLGGDDRKGEVSLVGTLSDRKTASLVGLELEGKGHASGRSPSESASADEKRAVDEAILLEAVKMACAELVKGLEAHDSFPTIALVVDFTLEGLVLLDLGHSSGLRPEDEFDLWKLEVVRGAGGHLWIRKDSVIGTVRIDDIRPNESHGRVQGGEKLLPGTYYAVEVRKDSPSKGIESD